ncbi:MAG: acetylglucosamine-6-sulfatase, partial [Proteobacteria bacterium]|nr:acetylglucosamine-6-sulfatase [Pseudomonadota bacterium]
QRRENPTPEREVLSKANEIISKLADGKTIHFMDINPLFVRADGTIPADLMPDFEHPSAKGYQTWAEAIEPEVAKLMGDAPIPPIPQN